MLRDIYQILQILRDAERSMELCRPWAQHTNPQKIHLLEGGGGIAVSNGAYSVRVTMPQLLDILKLLNQMYMTVSSVHVRLRRVFEDFPVFEVTHPRFDEVLTEMERHHVPDATRAQPKSSTLLSLWKAHTTGRLTIARPSLDGDHLLPKPPAAAPCGDSPQEVNEAFVRSFEDQDGQK